MWEDYDNGGNREGPVAHTLRLPYMGNGLVESDLQLIEAKFCGVELGEGRPFLHAHSFHDEGEMRANDNGGRVVDLADTPAKCAIDLLPPKDKEDVLRANATSGPNGGPTEHLEGWLVGRPDFTKMSGL